MENEISALEARQQEIEKELANPQLFKGTDKGPALAQEHKQIRETLDKLLDQWEEEQRNLENTKKSLGVGKDTL